jgi:hypothetical protein
VDCNLKEWQSHGVAKDSPDESFATPWLNVPRPLTHAL